jgi:glycosyltransferase involved in cell wall biosynthesis
MADTRTRVLVLFSSGEIGGAERSLTRMALAAHGTAVEYRLATCGGGDAWRQWAQDLGLPTASYPVFTMRGINLREVVRLVRACWQSRPQVLYVIGMRCATLVRLLRPMLPRHVVVHGIRSSFPKGTGLARRMAVSERLFAWLTDHYVVNSEAGADTLRRIASVPAGKITIIRNGVERASLSPPEFRERGSRVVVVANLNRYKGHIEFLNVVELVRRDVPDVEVLFIGRDDSGGEVMTEVQRRGLEGVVRALGFVASPDTLIATARVFALPSTQIEGCPTAVLEALVLGIPVIAYAIGGLPEIIESGATGVLVPPGSQTEFAAALVRLLQDEELNSRYSAAARIAAAARFSLAECTAQHNSLFKRLGRAVER